MSIPLRWIAIVIFLLSSSLNYMDRQLVAALAPTIKAEFHMSNQDFGVLLLGFSIVYGLSAPFAGLLIDRIGLNTGTTLAVAFWSVATMSASMVTSFTGLFASRATLGIAQAAGIPSFGKANGSYLESRELALGLAFNQIGISLGLIAAPLLATVITAHYGWRSVFLICGLLGFLWIPVWLWTARRIPHREIARSSSFAGANDMLRDRRFWALVIANILYMTLYTLWTNWTTVYFVEARGMTQTQANQRFVWIPPVFATMGALIGGAFAFRLIRAGMPVFRARMRVCTVSALLLLSTAAVPWMPTAAWATAVICFSFSCTMIMSSNIYAMPVDFFGAGRAAFGAGALTFAYGLMQAVVSPAIGWMIDHFGFTGVFVILAPFPLAAVGVLYWMVRDVDSQSQAV